MTIDHTSNEVINVLFTVHRDSWAKYFRSVGLPVAFWSAQQENERLVGVSFKLPLALMISLASCEAKYSAVVKFLSFMTLRRGGGGGGGGGRGELQIRSNNYCLYTAEIMPVPILFCYFNMCLKHNNLK